MSCKKKRSFVNKASLLCLLRSRLVLHLPVVNYFALEKSSEPVLSLCIRTFIKKLVCVANGFETIYRKLTARVDGVVYIIFDKGFTISICHNHYFFFNLAFSRFS